MTQSSDNHPTVDANRPTHDEDVRLVREGFLPMSRVCLDTDCSTCRPDDCAHPALDRILARYDALMEEHEAFVTDHSCGIDALQGCDYCAAHDKVEGMMG